MPAAQEQLTQPNELTPIPEIESVAGWKEIPIHETQLSYEPLVPVGIFSDYRHIIASSVYAGEHNSSPYTGGLEGSSIAVFVREGVAKRLGEVAEILPKGYHLMIMDGYRTLEVQGVLYEQYEQGLKVQHPDWTPEELTAETQKYVSLPSHDKTRPSPHNTGAAVDVVIVKVSDELQQEIDVIDAELTKLSETDWQKTYVLEMKRSEIIRNYGRVLNFGTRFDHGGPEAALRHFEEKAAATELSADEQEALINRRMLYNAMTKAGFEPYADEWWHYNDPASQMGAKVAGRKHAEYGAVEMSGENKAYAQMRHRHHHNSIRLSQGKEWVPPESLEEYYRVARAATSGNNPEHFGHMKDAVAKIEPPEDLVAA